MVYEYLVRAEHKKRDVRYRTIGEPLSTYAASTLLGRAIRVWKVVELDSKDEPLGSPNVLKDFWPRESSRSENQAQNEIFAAVTAARRGRDDQDQDDLKKYFMTILHDIVVHAEEQPDTTQLLIRTELDGDQGKYPVRHSDARAPDHGRTVVYALPDHVARKHCRVVFKEVGIPLSQLTNHNILFWCLTDAISGKPCSERLNADSEC